LPPSALDELVGLNVVYPMLFELKNDKNNKLTHSGVLEFSGDEGRVYIPFWVFLFKLTFRFNNI
jgi:ubiquitin fusion degradation protein 1